MTDYKVCARCVMDTSVPDIEFDQDGNCNYCNEFIERSGHLLTGDPDQVDESALENFVTRIKEAGKNKKYDCAVGVSGGVDSSWVLVKAVELGLRPLAVHMDNGWNSELAQNNIANLVRNLNVDLFTHVIDWHEYRKLMQAFFDADVTDVELLYDNAMIAVNYQQASKHGIKYILAGTNQATEGMKMPRSWNWLKTDKKNIKAIGKQFGGVKINTFPAVGTLDFMWFEFVRKVKWYSFLDLLDYQKDEALEVLKSDFGYKPYPYKHYESVFTRFYQGHLLLEKFGIDKRRIHLATLVVSKQMSRDTALSMLEGIPYPDELTLEKDKRYFIKKMLWKEQDLEDYIKRPVVAHDHYASERGLWEGLSNLYKKYVGKERGAV